VKFRCERDVLADAVGSAGRAATNRTGTLPVLAGVRMEVEGDRLTVTGTDLELTIRLTVDVGGERDGAAVVPARLVGDIVKALPAGAVSVELHDDEMSISAGRSHFSVRPLSLDDYPAQTEPAADAVTLPAATVAEALRQVVRAASTDDARAVLTGVLLASEEDGLRLVATDSYRLAVRDLPGTTVLGAGKNVLIPGRALNELQRVMGDVEELSVRLGDREATFEAAMLEAIRRVKILAQDSTPVRLTLGGDTVQLTAITQDVGNAAEEIDASYDGIEMTVAFNPDYLAAGIDAIDSDDVTLATMDPMKPAVLRGVGRDDYLYLLMPVRVP
jgi:DNA polymerase III subunit beta